MPGDREDAGTKELLRALLDRVSNVEASVSNLVRLLADTLLVHVRTEGGGTSAVIRFGEPFPSEKDWMRLVDLLARLRPTETPLERPVEPWQHLVSRRHRWREQLYIRGRNLTARQVVGAVKANALTPEEAADDLGIPVEAVHEALHYAEKYKDLLESETAYERHLLAQGGHGRGPGPLP